MSAGGRSRTLGFWPPSRSGAPALATAIAAALALAACGGDPGPAGGDDGGDGTEGTPLFRDATSSHLPTGALDGLSMDAHPGDLDGDGDLDLVIANEHEPNILLVNDGRGRFTDARDRLPSEPHDSEDIGIADFDGDGDPDVVSVSEDDRVNELYLGDGAGGFTDGGNRIPVTGTTNAVIVAELDGDGAPDLLLGNNGQNVALVNDGSGTFVDETADRLPARDDVTQDLEQADVDGDGDLDLIAGNEGPNRLMLNDGRGVFTDAPGSSIPLPNAPEETREADFGDVDGDGDPDLLFANVRAFVDGADPANRLLINDGAGRFTDETADRIPRDQDRSFDGDLLDVDGDGDLDVITSNSEVRMSEGQITDAPYRAYLNDGAGVFRDATAEVFPPGTTGTGFDAEFADFDGDGLTDLYLASRGSPDRLLLAVPR